MPQDPQNTEEENEQTPENAAYQGTAGTDIIVGSEEDDSISSNAGVDVVMGEGGDDYIAGGDNSDYLFGGSGDDTIEGGAGVDIIMGGSGDDILRGQGDTDIIRGGSGADTIEGGEGADLLLGDSGDDSITGGEGGDVIFGGAGADTIDGGAGADIIIGGTGDDTLTGGTGADTYVFGLGHGSDTITDFDTDEDTINLSAFGADLSYSDLTITATTDGTGTIITVPGEDGENNGITITLEGVTSTDVTESMFEFSNAGDNTIAGTTADEIITGGTGDDTMTGGGGGDTFVFEPGDGDDTVTDFSTADDKIDLTAFGRDVSFDDLTIAATTDGTGTVVTLPGDDGDTITLQGVTSTDVTADLFEFLAVDDTLTGTTADEIITGAYGDDTMTGGGGSDTFVFAPGDGDDTITDFSTADDKIDLTAFGRDVLFDDLTIAATTDGTGTVITLPGDDGDTITLQGVTSTDLTADQFVFGTADTPGTLFIGSEAETEFTGTEFADTIIGAEGDDTLDGGRGNDWIFGNEGADDIQGGDGDDVIFAGEGDDTINAGTGSNYVQGGAGADTFAVESGQTLTTIGDFTDGEDQIDLSSISGITAFSDLTITDDDGTAMIDLSSQGAGTIRLTGVATTDLDADDFVFAESTTQVDDSM